MMVFWSSIEVWQLGIKESLIYCIGGWKNYGHKKMVIMDTPKQVKEKAQEKLNFGYENRSKLSLNRPNLSLYFSPS
jgi:hypothetical protein